MINFGNKFNILIIITVVYLFTINITCNAGLRSKIIQGNNLYHKEKYEEALNKYRDALIDDPESKELHFNIGDGLYKTGNYEEAIKEFEKSTYSKDIKIQAKSYYNIGNCLYRMGKLPESIIYYKKSLELNPDDEDTKYNIEFVQKKIKENLNKQPQEQQQQQQQQSQKQQQQNKSDKDKQEKEKQEQQKQEGMSKEDAERILNKFEEDEKQAQKQRKKLSIPQQIQVEQDW